MTTSQIQIGSIVFVISRNVGVIGCAKVKNFSGDLVDVQFHSGDEKYEGDHGTYDLRHYRLEKLL